MSYTAIGIMSGSSMDGLDIACIEFSQSKGKWSFHIIAAATKTISTAWIKSLSNSTELSAKDYLLLHCDFGSYCGEKVLGFLSENKIQNKIDCIGFHGHTTFHLPQKKMTHQLGDGAALAAITGIPVVSDLRAIDVALGGQGAPIVPIGERLLFSSYDFYLNIGGIANISIHQKDRIIAYDVCPANRVLNMLAILAKKKFDKDGKMAGKGIVNEELLKQLNALNYYSKGYPKSLANDFGTEIVYPLVRKFENNIGNALATYTEHIAQQVMRTVRRDGPKKESRMMITGGGALNKFLVERLQYHLDRIGVEAIVPAVDIVNYKEAIVMALIGVLRLRNEKNVLKTVTGASRDSCGGALWSTN